MTADRATIADIRVPSEIHCCGRIPRVTSVAESELWCSKSPRWGTVRTVTISSGYALVLDDLNSDLREVDLAIFRRHGDRWRVILSQDDVGFEEIGDSDPCRGHHVSGASGYGYAAGEHYAWAWGRGRPGSAVQIQFKGETIELEQPRTTVGGYSFDRPPRAIPMSLD